MTSDLIFNAIPVEIIMSYRSQIVGDESWVTALDPLTILYCTHRRFRGPA